MAGVHFTDGRSLQVTESAAQIAEWLRANPSGLLCLTPDTSDGAPQPVWVNPAQIEWVTG